jgi:hypothetical protein
MSDLVTSIQPENCTKPVFEVRIETVRNLLRVAYHGAVSATAAKAAVDQASALLLELRPGFSVLTDLTGLESMELECVPHLTRLMDLCTRRGIGTTLRVIPDPRKDIGLTILANIHYRTGIHIVTCQSLAEAEATLSD